MSNETTGGAWIPVAERLPPDDTLVLLWDALFAQYQIDQVSDPSMLDGDYTHWQPLPPPPTHDSQEGK